MLDAVLNKEPIAVVSAVRLLVLAAVTFGLGLSVEQVAALMAALEGVLMLFSRSKVYSSDSIRKISVDTYMQGALDAVSEKKAR